MRMRMVETRVHAYQLADGTPYDLYVPATYTGGDQPFRLLVSVLPVHPNIPRYRALELFGDFAAAARRLVLAPRFDIHSGFQFLGLGTPERYDLRLLQMVDAVARSHTLATPLFELFGYSAGGQFAHRFLYLHGEHLRSVVIGAPGNVTLPRTDEPWPAGLAKMADIGGKEVDLTGGQWPDILLFVGDQDVTTELLDQDAAANRFGRTRLERARTLHHAWLKASIPHQYHEVAGMGHGDIVTDDRPMQTVWQFLSPS
jgi:pimeloyl-ACP methyl ester carboxylesterase